MFTSRRSGCGDKRCQLIAIRLAWPYRDLYGVIAAEAIFRDFKTVERYFLRFPSVCQLLAFPNDLPYDLIEFALY